MLNDYLAGKATSFGGVVYRLIRSLPSHMDEKNHIPEKGLATCLKYELLLRRANYELKSGNQEAVKIQRYAENAIYSTLFMPKAPLKPGESRQGDVPGAYEAYRTKARALIHKWAAMSVSTTSPTVEPTGVILYDLETAVYNLAQEYPHTPLQQKNR